MLSDVGSATIRAWGILNQHAIGRAEGIPYPGTFVLDRSGRVVSRSFEESYEERATAASVLDALQPAASSAGAPVAGRHVAVIPEQSDHVAATGQHLTLGVEIRPAPGIHVYAPGQDGYIPVTLDLQQSDAFEAADTTYPEPRDYLFQPLHETVRVFDRPFRLTRDVTMALTRDVRRGGAAHEALTVRGSVGYQACDDRVCFAPDEVPVTWTITLAPLEP
jgi:DsbC/DsbD-like thiol-disulfide interchange protein